MGAASPDTPAAQAFRRRLASPLQLGAYLAARTPLAAFAGVRITSLDGERCEVRVPYGWRSRNPFGSIYFAALAMAAEMSAAGLVLMAARSTDRRVSALPVDLHGSFEKKATRTTTFVCEDGAAAFDAVNRALASGEAEHLTTRAVGRLEDGTVISRFEIAWSFKRK